MTTKPWLTPDVIEGFAGTAFNLNGKKPKIDQMVAQSALANILLNGKRADSDEIWQALQCQYPSIAERLESILQEHRRGT